MLNNSPLLKRICSFVMVSGLKKSLTKIRCELGTGSIKIYFKIMEMENIRAKCSGSHNIL